MISRRNLAMGGGALVALAAGGYYFYPRHPKLSRGQTLQSLVPMVNNAKDPGKFEANLTIDRVITDAFGGKTALKLYNQSNPAQIIRIKAGTQCQFNITNNLAEETTIHWHGLDIPADVDGNPMDPLKPGETREVRFAIDAKDQGNYWFHPHPNATTAEQVAIGLAGALVVDPLQDPLAPLDLIEHVLFITDLGLDDQMQIRPSTAMEMMNGRVGEHIFVNGQIQPSLKVHRDAPTRFKIYNATSSQYFNMNFGQAKMVQLGSDGGYISAPRPIDTIFLAPASRMDVLVYFNGEAGQKFALTPKPYERGLMGGAKPLPLPASLLDIVLDGTMGKNIELPLVLRDFADLGATNIVKRVVFSEDMAGGMPDMKAGHDMKSMSGGTMDMGAKPESKPDSMSKSMSGAMNVKFLINNQSFDMNRVDLVSKAGQVEIWEVENQSDMDHPFHIHGVQFQHINSQIGTEITKPDFRAHYDIINVRPREIVRIKMVQRTPGLRMFHCHILEHEEQGMMGVLQVI